jgi:hypothetical protein
MVPNWHDLVDIVDAVAPTTGAPHDYYFPPGCVCHVRDDADWGEHYVAPREGCPVHTPWAFPGYTLAEIT